MFMEGNLERNSKLEIPTSVIISGDLDFEKGVKGLSGLGAATRLILQTKGEQLLQELIPQWSLLERANTENKNSPPLVEIWDEDNEED